MAHVYFHIDLNCFYAAAEMLLNHDLKGKPIVVCGKSRRSVVTTASYEARSYGIHSAMILADAYNLCPNLIVCEPHFAYYKELSDRFMALIKSYSDLFEQASIDECYIDVTKIIQTYKRPLDLAVEIQKRVLEELGLSCSIGVGPNLFLAKMASDMKKPLGITVLRIREAQTKLWPLPVNQLFGVGKKSNERLKKLNINTIGDLATYANKEDLYPIFGKNTQKMIDRCNGIDHRELVIDAPSKSMGVSTTMLEDLYDEEEIAGVFRLLSRKLSKRLLKEEKAGKEFSVRIRFSNFQTIDRSITLDTPIWKANDLFKYAMQMFHKNWEGEPVRLVGITVASFIDMNSYKTQLNLFDEQLAIEEETDAVLDDLNKLLNDSSLMRARDLLKG